LPQPDLFLYNKFFLDKDQTDEVMRILSRLVHLYNRFFLPISRGLNMFVMREAEINKSRAEVIKESINERADHRYEMSVRQVPLHGCCLSLR